MNENTKHPIIKHFTPAWFAASMGTGGLANLLITLGSNNAIIRYIGLGIGTINAVLFIALLIPWILRWVYHYPSLSNDMKHPAVSNFFVTMPVALVILAITITLVNNLYIHSVGLIVVVVVLWVIGTIAVLLFSVNTIYNLMNTEEMNSNFVNFSWLITPVASIIVPLLGNAIVMQIANARPQVAQIINLVDIMFFGIGFMLFVIFAAVVFNRFLHHKMPHAMALPTFWILLGPVGVGTSALMRLADVNTMLGYLLGVREFYLLALLLWGFGFWALVLNLWITFKYLKQHIPFTLSWWAFIFPLVAYTSATFAVFQYTDIHLVLIFAYLLLAFTFVLWGWIFIQTVIGVINKKLLLPQK